MAKPSDIVTTRTKNRVTVVTSRFLFTLEGNSFQLNRIVRVVIEPIAVPAGRGSRSPIRAIYVSSRRHNQTGRGEADGGTVPKLANKKEMYYKLRPRCNFCRRD